MTALIKGTGLKVNSGAIVDSLIPMLRTASKTLVPGDDQVIQVDPTIADTDFTLPDGVTNPGVNFFLKRSTDGANLASLLSAGSDTIDGTANGYIFSLLNDYIGVYSDGTIDWKIYTNQFISICTIKAAAASFTVTTSPVKFNDWGTVVFSTPGKLVGNLSTNVIDILEFQGATGADGYQVNVTFNFEYTNNNTVSAQLFANGALVGTPVSVNALGTGKPISISIFEQVGITALTTLELHVSAENGGTINAINATMQCKRIGR